MSVQLSPPIPDPLFESRTLMIHSWISSLPDVLSRHQRLPSDTIGRAESPLLGFAPQDSSHDPLHRPSPNYIRCLPEEVVLTTNKRPFQDKLLPLPSQEARVPSPVPEDAEHEFSFPCPPVTRDFPPANLARYKTYASLPTIRRPIVRQPSLPIFGTTAHPCHVSDYPRIRSNSTATPFRTDFQVQSSIPSTKTSVTSFIPAASLSSDLERQKLNALVIASGLADEEELQVETLGLHSSSSQAYLGDSASQELPTFVERRPSYESDAMTSIYQVQTISSPRASTLLQDLDEFDEDASYYEKEMNTLFSPYSRPPSVSRAANGGVIEPAVSKWSLSSSIQMDLEKNRRSSPTKSIKNKRDKIKSFISRFTPNSPPPTDKSFSTFFGASPVKHIRRERSYSDALSALTSQGSVSPRIQGTAYGSWESVPPTPTTAVSSTMMSISTGYFPVTPSDNEDDPRDAFRVSEEKLVGGAGLSRISSRIFARDTSSSISGSNTSVPNSPVDTVPPQFPLKHAASTASLKINGLKGLASMIGLASADNLDEESPNETKRSLPQLSQPQPRSFKERMKTKNNGSTLSLILGIGNKGSKPKRKLLINGVEKGDHHKYKAISNWCEGFGQVIVQQAENGAIVADFRDPSVASTVCRLQAQVYIQGAGSVSLSWTTKDLSKLTASV